MNNLFAWNLNSGTGFGSPNSDFTDPVSNIVNTNATPDINSYALTNNVPLSTTNYDNGFLSAAYAPTTTTTETTPAITDQSQSQTASSGFNTNDLFGGLGKVMGLAQTGLSIWGALQQMSMYKDMFNFQKGVTETNLQNQISSYNTNLQERARMRATYRGVSDVDKFVNNYVEENKAKRY